MSSNSRDRWFPEFLRIFLRFHFLEIKQSLRPLDLGYFLIIWGNLQILNFRPKLRKFWVSFLVFLVWGNFQGQKKKTIFGTINYQKTVKTYFLEQKVIKVYSKQKSIQTSGRRLVPLTGSLLGWDTKRPQ